MTPALGKRKRTSRHELKRDHEDVDSTSSSGSDTGTQEIFRRHFESKFKPLERNGKSVNFSDKQAPASLDAQEENVEHDWSGFSSQAESDEGPMVVNQANFPASAAPRGVKSKSFMVCLLHSFYTDLMLTPGKARETAFGLCRANQTAEFQASKS